MDYKEIVFERKGDWGTLFLNRPEVLNALSDEMRAELFDFLQHAAVDRTLRVLIISGKGRAFSAGADLNVLKQRYENYRKDGQQDISQRMMLPRALATFPKPLIAAINGPAVGFGATMPLNCDIRIASIDARFSFAFARLGVTPEFCSSYFLPRLVGLGQAAELIYTAKTIDAEEALRIGLINHLVQPEALLPEAENIAAQIAQLPPLSVHAAKRLLRHGIHSTLEQVIDYEGLIFQQASQYEEHYIAVSQRHADLNSSKK